VKCFLAFILVLVTVIGCAPPPTSQVKTPVPPATHTPYPAATYTPYPSATARPTPVPPTTDQDKPDVEATASPVPVSSGYSFKFRYACLDRALEPCELLEAPGGMMDRIRERTNGQVDIQITSFSESGLDGFDTLWLLEDGTIEMAEVFSGYVEDDYPPIGAVNLWGLIPDNEVNLKVIDAVSVSIRADLLENFGVVVIGESYYPNNYIYATRPVRTVSDFAGMKIRSHSITLADLIDGMGAEAQFMSPSEVYTGLERGILDAAVTCGSCGASLGWFEVADYLVGPFVALGVTYISINEDRWNEIPDDMQAIILEEGAANAAQNRELVVGDWAQKGIGENEAGGMEYLEFSSEIKAALKKASMEQVVPNWVDRVGGADTPAVAMFNTHVAPVLGVLIDSEGNANED
jgi:TRAP-type C4-dicarboxylate transport system substrate-binding protein